MSQNFTGRLTLIVAIILVALWAIFPNGNIKQPNLKPGIDMVGGTSLLYEIKQPPGGYHGPKTLAEEVMDSLKKRVDPQGVRNLIWRPQGNTRLEIQMPTVKGSIDSAAKRQNFADAQRQLEATNVRSSVVLDAVATLKNEARAKRLAELAMDSETRKKLFADLGRVHDEVQQAAQQKNAEQQAKKELEYDALKTHVEDTNLSAASLETLLSSNPQTKNEKIAELKKRFADFPSRVAALGAFDKAFDEYNLVKGSIDDAADLKRLLQGSGVLEFHILVDDLNAPEARAMIERLHKRGPVVEGGDTMKWFPVDRAEEFKNLSAQYGDKTYALAYITPEKSMDNRPGKAPWALESSRPIIDQNSGERKVGFSFDAQGAKYFGDLTGANLPRADGSAYKLAIMLDDKLISAPNIHSRIGAHGEITGGGDGGFTEKDAGYLISTLNAGSLPARLTDEPISERTVGPQLGEDNLRAGLVACAFGLVVVAVFLIGYYYLAGVVATIAVLMNMVLILGAMAAINATFTLPGVAGIVLTIGMAVDANVLIFERLREEQQRGLSLRMALRNAYDRAFSAILDGNVTTGITSLFLYWFGSEEVKGFGLTLLIGIASSLFTALFVTRTIFGVLIDKFGVTKLSSLPMTFPKLDEKLRPNIDWLGKAKWFYAFSLVFMAIGLVLFGVKLKKGEMLDIEFASGTNVQFELKQAVPIEQVRKIILDVSEKNPKALPAPSVQSVDVAAADTMYELLTPNPNAAEVKSAVIGALGDKLKLELPSKFAGVGAPFDAAMDKQIVPITSSSQQIAGFVPQGLSEHLNGAAIILDDLDPPLAASEIKLRIDRARLQPQPGQETPVFREFDVVANVPPGQPAKTAIVLVSDAAFPFDKDEARWKDQLALPMWRVVNEAIHNPPDLQKVVNFDAQVAGETAQEATLALVMSIVGIMIYIWMRFGNLKYATATVWALLHDTLFVIAAVGFAHFIAGTAIGNWLMIEPFRVNLNLVAAILTVMGYSMNDTVVIFDRIRENRGKMGILSRRIINDSINQTLSRTLLTGGTTILTILVMYIRGGPGIHGFTYALLLGILVGTYSSIAIASPVLLFGKRETEEAPRRTPVGALQRA